ncbi:phage tail protein [Enterobacter hormaechei]|uniref:phage tail-collar fiber domain-containing protein n=1 Tax=Enterobacter hormaechei TaxID=158836 RepID=UPI002DBDE035|nr:phage tail protein [Enterobacter hormaechei]MEB6523831.1 phage tail protein [Enterobacter hormaechei]
MAEKYYSILTNRGKELETQSSATGKPVIIKDFVVGDGNGQAVKPDPAQTKLVREVYRSAISALQVSPDQANQFFAQLVLPVAVGGFVVREVGLLTDAGELYSVANCAAIEKPENGVSVSLQFRLAVSDAANVELKVATGDGLFLRIDKNLSEISARGEAAQKGAREAIGVYDATTSRKGLVQLSSETDSSSETLAATPKAVREAAKEIKDALGTSASKDVVTSKTDATAGRMPVVGWMGLGGYGSDILLSAADARKPLRNGFYGVQSEPTYGNAALISFGYDSGSQVHLIAKQGGQAPLIGLAGSTPQGVFGDWGKIYTEFQKPTATEVGAVPYRSALGTVDLNTVRGTQYGRFNQALTANATTARNYPITEAGELDVHQTSANGAEACVQEYRTFSSRRVFLRSYNPADNTWTEWCEFYTTAKKPTATEVGALPVTGGTVTGNVVANGYVRAGNTRKLEVSSSNTSTLDGIINLWGNADRPTVLEFKDATGYHFYSQRNVNGSISFNFNGAAEVRGAISAHGEIVSRAANGLRIAYGNFGAFWRNDGTTLYLMLTNSGDSLGNYNSLRPLYVNLTTGALQSGTPLSVYNTITASEQITAGKEMVAGYSGPYAWAEQYKSKAPFFNSYSTTNPSEYHPVIKQQATVTGKNSWAFSMGTLVSGDVLSWHLHMKGSGSQDINFKWDTNGNFNAPGQVNPGSYANFDNRYYTKTQSDAGYMPKTGAYTKAESDGRFQPKGSYTPAGQAYTKAESDARYNLKNTATKSANAMTHKDASTGVMEVVMSNINVPSKTNVNVTFPAAFPNACVGVVITYNGAGHGSGDDSAIYVPSYSRTGCTLYAHNADGKFMLIAKGY